MLSLLCFLMTLFTSNETILFDFNSQTNPSSWAVVNDVVMGGKSSSKFAISEAGHGLFSGDVSLENNGGFASVQYRDISVSVNPKSSVYLKLKGDGKSYQFRIKSNSNDYYSYVAEFKTSGQWEEIRIPLKSFYPSFRGRKLDIPNFNRTTIEQLAFLIANKRPEKFQLEIDRISLR
ncbi:MAG: CIA30 family protein [Luteibaculum sp.]